MKYTKDLTGQRFGRLRVLEFAGMKSVGKRGSRSTWLCLCDCGKTKVICRNSLVTGNTKSCGCYEIEIKKSTHYKHGMAKTRLWNIWVNMHDRCERKNSKSYKYYGERGIYVCKEWNDFKNFAQWAFSNGYSDELTIDRIDSDGCYSPDNCRWATRKEQSRNRRNTVKLSLSEIAEIEGISYQKAYDKYVRIRSI